ncbi:T9SS type A sorting domain-containing protein [Schleiferiaceae bacterium]|nr:T9SS type A sorting domain-containing protein [Schleiferiaceae bacterium]MDB2627664.1 T9SS type A sorting domain-containing protein [Schleiferiaceae bacterium]
MKKITLLICSLMVSVTAVAQRYTTEIFNDNEIIVSSDVNYGVNFNPYVDSAMLGGTNLQPLQADFYMPSPTADTTTNRPVVIVWHTGSFLPKGLNGSPLGTRQDSAVVEMCRRFAKMGYVSIAASYRLGWLANSTNLDVRRGSNLLAVYYSIQDAKALVRYLNLTQMGAGNPYGINASNTIMVGQGSGGYLTFAYATIDKHSEVAGPSKFKYQDSTGIFGQPVLPGDAYVDTSIVGDIDGYGAEVVITGQNTLGLPTMDYSSPGRNYINHAGMPDDILMAINMGGAMGDGAWLEQGDVPMLSIHSKYDFFAPYDTGMVYVPIGQQFFPVVSVTGSYAAIKAANAFGNNDIFLNENYTDQVWVDQQATNPTNEECLYTIEIAPPNATMPWVVHTAPWNWYDSNDPMASQNPANPNVEATSQAWIDTVMSFIVPRMATVLQAEGVPAGIVEAAQSFKVYPNPASDLVSIKGTNGSSFNRVQAFDITGRVVYTSDASGSSLSIDVSNWNNGIYLVQIATDSGVQVKRIVVN